MGSFNLKAIVRENIGKLKPYSSARDEFSGEAAIFLDANESPYNSPLNRYPDPHQRELKAALAPIKKVNVEQIFLGNGSDEAIDLIIRAFCEPGVDNIIVPDPSYGMYHVCADINNVQTKFVKLNSNFTLNADEIIHQIDKHTKVIFICSPNNPTGNQFKRTEILKIINHFNGIVVIDEAYIDFSEKPGFLSELSNFPNLMVLQTFSKSWAMAGIRLGLAFASAEIIDILSKIKYPYNINQLTLNYALDRIKNYETERLIWLKLIIEEKKRMQHELQNLKFVKEVFPSDANFWLVKIENATEVYNKLVMNGIVVRNRNNVTLCENCLRFTVGSTDENNKLLNSLEEIMVMRERHG